MERENGFTDEGETGSNLDCAKPPVSAEVTGYAIPGELAGVMEDALAAEDAMACAVKGYFKFQVRNAVMLGRIARDKKAEFWRGIYALYPELAGENLSYSTKPQTVVIR